MQDALYPRCTPPVRHGPTDGRRLTIDNRQWTESSALQSAHGSSGSLLAAASVGRASPRGSAFPGAASADGPARLASASAERHSAFSIRPPLIAAPGKSLTVAPSLRFSPQTRKTDQFSAAKYHALPDLPTTPHTLARPSFSPPIFSSSPLPCHSSTMQLLQTLALAATFATAVLAQTPSIDALPDCAVRP